MKHFYCKILSASRGVRPSDVTVACGAHRITRPGPSPEDRNEVRLAVGEIVLHEDFSW